MDRPGQARTEDRLERRHHRGPVRRQVPDRREHASERRQRPADNYVGSECEVARAVQGMQRKRPERLRDQPEQRGESEAPQQRRGRQVALAGLLAGEQVHRERDGGTDRGQEPKSVERRRVVRADHEEATEQGKARGCPQPARQGAPVRDLQPHEQQHRPEVLHGQGDADVEPGDRREVKRGDPREPDHPEQRQPRDIAPADSQQRRPRQREPDTDRHERPDRAKLGQPRRRQMVGEQELGQRAVQRPQRRRQGSERIAEPGRTRAGRWHQCSLAASAVDASAFATARLGLQTGRGAAW